MDGGGPIEGCRSEREETKEGGGDEPARESGWKGIKVRLLTASTTSPRLAQDCEGGGWEESECSRSAAGC